MIRSVIFLACLLLLQPWSARAESNAYLRVWNFDNGILTDQGGYYNHFKAGTSEASIHLIREVRRGKGGRSMKIEYKKTDRGFCGAWMHIFEEKAPKSEREYVEVREHPFLSCWVRGERGGEEFTIQMADGEWIDKDDSRPAGLVSKYLGGPIRTNWQEVLIPYKDFRLTTTQAGGIVFNFTESGEGTVYVDDIYFKKRPDVPVPVSEAELKPSEKQGAIARAMWVWKTEPLLMQTDDREEFFSFCIKHGINELFLQIPYRFINDLTPNVECVLQHKEELRAFLSQARQVGILCHGLDGFPEFSLRPHHPRVLAQVKAILAFNDTSLPVERFYGIHLDNEPYQILGFDGPERTRILEEYLELNDKAMELVREHGSDIVYGVDIPFWFDEEIEKKSDRNRVTYKGVTKNAAEHIIDLCDNVGIMDYRNFAGGADGTIRHGQGEIEYAEKVEKKIYIGLETFKYQPTTVCFLYAVPESKWQGLKELSEGFLLRSRVDEFPVRTLKAGEIRLIGLVEPANRSEDPAFRTALHHLYARYGASSHQEEPNFDQLENAAKLAIRKNGQFTGFEPFQWKDNNDRVLATGFKTTEVMLDKITFAGMTKRQLEATIKETAEAFSNKKSFHGIAIHYYDTYRQMDEL